MNPSDNPNTTTMPVRDTEHGRLFDEEYYRTGCGPVPYARDQPQWARVFGSIADRMISSERPQRVFDAGCAMGFLVESFWDRGVEAWGVDISPYAIAQVRRDMQPYCRVGTLAEPIEGRYDLVTCIEVLEHMAGDDPILAIRNLCQVTDRILFSSTPFDVVEPTHLNVKPTLVWLRLFEEQGFAPDLLFDATFVCPHAMLLRRRAPHPPEVQHVFSELVRNRDLAIRLESKNNEHVVRAARLEAEAAAAAQRAAQRAVQVEAEAAAAAQRAASLESEIAGLKAELEQRTEREPREPQTEEVLQAELQWERRTNEVLQRAQRELTSAVERGIRGSGREPSSESEPETQDTLTPWKAELEERLARMEQAAGQQRAELASLMQRTGGSEAVAGAALQGVESILHSRTWLALTKMGGWLLAVAGRRR